MKIKRIKINKLYGYKNIDLDFQSNCKILIGDNGLGKTTILNIVYFTLTKKFERLSHFDFETIEISFQGSKKILLSKDLMVKFLERKDENSESHFAQLMSNFSASQMKDIRAVVTAKVNSEREEQKRRLELSALLKKSGLNINAPTSYIFQTINKYINDLDSDKFYDTIADIDNCVDCRIFYFPTFRRIEEDYKNIKKLTDQAVLHKYNFDKHSEKANDDMLNTGNVIQFGMADVRKQIQSITSKIMQSSVIGFSDITTDMLHQLLTDFPDVKPSRTLKANKQKVDIILDRLASNIPDTDRVQIRNTIESGATSNKGLVYFINKLTELYQNQDAHDSAIKQFTEVCNSYFRGKRFVYNEREISLTIESDLDLEYSTSNDGYFLIKSKELQLEQLSSGEKQIVSLFSKIFLESGEKFIVLFDEPELSLSVLWQMKLLPDILKSNRCESMLAVTHSPFIYENDLEEYASNLENYIN